MKKFALTGLCSQPLLGPMMIVLAMIDVEAIIYLPDVSSVINGLFNIILTLA